MTRLFYEKHGPGDPLLAPLLANLGPGQPQRLASWLAEALGGPARGGGPGGSDGAGGGADVRAAAIGETTQEFGEAQRARWATLLAVSADEAGLPADPEFRSVLSSCLEWASRTALAMSAAETAPRQVPVPRWDWGPGGPPAAPAAETGEPGEAAALPGPEEPVSFATHIKPLFRERDRQSMSFAFDLWSFQDVSSRAAEILGRLQDGSMPCDGAWPAAKIEVFQRWADTGLQP
jgi:truncated hemoglobin YjbI